MIFVGAHPSRRPLRGLLRMRWVPGLEPRPSKRSRLPTEAHARAQLKAQNALRRGVPCRAGKGLEMLAFRRVGP